jgi:hypothetical protein
MYDSLSLGPTPYAESCAQVGADDYSARARKECKAFINQLRRLFGPEPEGARLAISSNPHDFGSYLDVVCKFNDLNEKATEYAYKLEANTPEEWDAEAREELNWPAKVR